MPVMAGMSLYGEFDGVVFGHYRVRPFTSSSSRSFIAAELRYFQNLLQCPLHAVQARAWISDPLGTSVHA